jgi:hypothetical protein
LIAPPPVTEQQLPHLADAEARGRTPFLVRPAGVVTILVLCVLFIAGMRWLTYPEPVRGDEALYAVIGHELLEGRQLYSDLWDHKPPGIHLAYATAELLFGYGPHQLYLLNLIANAGILLGLYRAGSMLAGRGGGIGAAIVFALASAFPHWEGYQPNTELFVNLLLVWSFCLVYRLGVAPSWGLALTFGVVIGLASLFKQVAVVPAILFGLTYLLSFIRDPGRRWQALRYMLVAGAVSAALWVGVCIWFAAQGTFSDFYDAVFVYNRAYSGNLLRNVWDSRHLGHKSYLVTLILPCALVPLAAPRLDDAQRRGWYLLAAWALGSHIAVALAARWVEYYYELWMPVYALAAGAMIGALASAVIERPPVFRWALLALVFLPLGLRLYYGNQFGSPPWLIYNPGSAEYHFRHDPVEAAEAVDRVIRPGERFFALGVPGDSPPLLFYTRQHPASGVFFDFPLYPYRPFPFKLESRMVRDLDRNPPDLIALSRESGPRTKDGKRDGWGKQLTDWVSNHYTRCQVPNASARFEFFARRSSALESRLTHPDSMSGRE